MSEPKSEAEKAAEECNKSAADYCKTMRIDFPHIKEMSSEALVWNLRFMAYCAGYRAGAASAVPEVEK